MEVLGPDWSKGQRVEAIDTHRVNITVAGQVEPDNHHQVGEYQDRTLEIIALPFAIHVGQEEYTEYNRYHIPLGEDEAVITVSVDFLQAIYAARVQCLLEGMRQKVRGIEDTAVECTE